MLALVACAAPVAVVPTATAVPPPLPTVTVTVTPADTTTATIVTATVEASDDDADVTCVGIEWGDRTGEFVCGYGHSLEPGGPSRVRYTFTHAYRRPGVWPVVATATSEDADGNAGDGRAATTVRVTPGPTPSNGPHRPRPNAAEVRPPGGSRRTTYLDLTGTDRDGWVVETVVEWGDGSRSRRTFGTAGCEDPLLTWPGGEAPRWAPSHRYARTGSRTVTVRTTSAGCDGADRQTAVQRFRVRVPSTF